MKKLLTLVLANSLIFACSASLNDIAPTSVQSGSFGPGHNNTSPTPAPSAAQSLQSQLRNLQAGILPDPSLTKEEEKLAGILAREVKPDFPLKIGILLYSDNSNLEDKYRKNYYSDFLKKVKSNKNIDQIIEISNGLIAEGADIEEIRKLGARFQVSMILVINDQYLAPAENKEAIITPIDILTGSRTWESFSNIEIYALDVLNGVFAFSTSKGFRTSEKYIKSDEIQNKDRVLQKDSAKNSWSKLAIKVNQEIIDFKNRIESSTKSNNK